MTSASFSTFNQLFNHAADKASHPPGNYPQGLHSSRHRILQVRRKYVSTASARASGKLKLEPESILFQREVYPSDDFHMVKKYGQVVLVTQDLALENYLEKYVLLLAWRTMIPTKKCTESSSRYRVSRMPVYLSPPHP